MRKMIILLALAAIVGCENNGCHECTTTITTSVSVQLDGYPQTSTVENTVCDEDIENYEREGTFTVSATVSGISATSRSVTRCR